MTISLITLLLFAETQKNPPMAASARFEQISKQAAEAREQERVEDAIRLYREAVRLRPNWKEGWWYLGTMFYDQDRYEEGRTVLRRFTTLDSKVAPGWALLGLCEYETKINDAALAHLQLAIALGLDEKTQLDVVTEYHAVLLLTRSGQFEKALEMLVKLAERGAERPEFAEAAGLAGLRKPLLPAELPPTERELVLQVGRAVLDTGARRAAAAQKEFEDLVSSHPGTPNIHYLFGSFLMLGDSDAGLRELSKELEISPRHVPALLQVAFEYLKRGDAAAALPYARKATEIDSTSFVAHNALGRALVESGDLDKGIKELELSKQQAPGSPQTRIALASAYAKAGRSEDAAHERAEFLKLKQLAKKPGDQ
jgi:tetratricopeptide (TPR) repeat protein